LKINTGAVLLEIKNLTVSYEGFRAVDGLSIILNEGESLGIIGESGCGKSSLARAVMGLLGKGEASGIIKYRGADLLKLTEMERKSYRWKEIALVFQNSREVFNPVLTVGEQVGEPLREHFNLTAAEVEDRVVQLLGLVGLEANIKSCYPHQLSGGMVQKALLAMSLSCSPRLLIMDEPTSSLDAESKEEALNLINRLRKILGFSLS